MKFRRFTKAAIDVVRDYLAGVKVSNDTEKATLSSGREMTRAELVLSPSLSEPVTALADLDFDEKKIFPTTFAFCEYLDSIIKDRNPLAYRDDVGFWTWLAMVYLPQLVKVKGGRVELGAIERLVYSPENYQRQYRHLFAGPYYIFDLYREYEYVCKAVMWHKLFVHPDLTEQIVSRYDFAHNPAYMAVVNRLYFDETSQRVRKGAGGEGSFAARNLVRVIDQLAMTRDFFNVEDAESLLTILPKQFSSVILKGF